MPSRNYKDIEKRLNALTHPHVDQTIITTVNDYPIYRLLIGEPNRPTVFLTGGMHGDELAGVEAIFRFLEQDLTPVLSHFRFFIIPCINPTGYVANTRLNAQGKDINRAFDSKETPESKAIKKALEGHRFVFHLDMHE
ncbi:MAG: M14 family zinc carboxypeptidase, partial [Candidatus Latescibacterota bacterium]